MRSLVGKHQLSQHEEHDKQSRQDRSPIQASVMSARMPATTANVRVSKPA